MVMCEPSVLKFTKFQLSYIIIQAFSINSLYQPFEDISSDHNFQSLNILCLIETRLHSSFNEIHKFIDTSKFNHILMVLSTLPLHLIQEYKKQFTSYVFIKLISAQ